MGLEIGRVIEFYAGADGDKLEEYESALDAGDIERAYQVVNDFSRQAMEKGYLDEPPQVGDLVYVIDTSRYGSLVTLSDDGKLAVLRTWIGPYVVPFDQLRRVR
jgi:hypothetical protein